MELQNEKEKEKGIKIVIIVIIEKKNLHIYFNLKKAEREKNVKRLIELINDRQYSS